MTIVASSPEKHLDLWWRREITFKRRVGPLDRYELRDNQTASNSHQNDDHDFLRLDEHRVSVGYKISYLAMIDPAETS
jgi:hypothetical protein